MLNFFDKPQNLKKIESNLKAFHDFCLDLFEHVLLANDFLQYDKKGGESNFIIALSYPSTWSQEDGCEFLEIVQEWIPLAIYAFREDVCLRQSLFKCDDNLLGTQMIIDIDSLKTSYITDSETKNDLSVRLSLIEEYILESIIIDGKHYIEEVSKDIKGERFNSAEFFLRKNKNHYIDRDTSDLIYNKFANLLGNSLSYIINNGEYKKINVISEEPIDELPLFIELLGQFFPKADINFHDEFYICHAILNYVYSIIVDANRCLDDLFDQELSLDSFPSKFDLKIGEVVEKTIQEIYDNAGVDFFNSNYVEGDHRSLNHFTKTASNFYKKILCKEFGFVESANVGTKMVIDGLLKDTIKRTIEIETDCDTSSYFLLSLSGIMFWNKTLDDDIKNVYKRNSYSNYTKERSRNAADFLSFMYIQFNKVSTRIDHFIPYSWLLNENKCRIHHCFMDFIASKHEYSVIKPNLNSKEICVDSIANVIECAINLIIKEALMGLYKIEEGKFILSEISYFANFSTFNYNTYFAIKRDVEKDEDKFCITDMLSKKTVLYNQINDINKYKCIAQMISVFFLNPLRNKYLYDSNGELSKNLTIEDVYYKLELDYCAFWKTSTLEKIYNSPHKETYFDNDADSDSCDSDFSNNDSWTGNSGWSYDGAVQFFRG